MTTEQALRDALQALLHRYTGLVNCGDCGNWDPEAEREVIAARAALSQPQAAPAEGSLTDDQRRATQEEQKDVL